MRKRSINISDESELELAWSKKSSSYFEHNFPLFLLSCILNTSIKVRNILHWVNFLVKKIFSNIFCSTFWWGRYYLNIFYIPVIFYYCEQVLFTLRVSSLLSLLNDASVDIVNDEALLSFLLKLNSHHAYTFTSPLQQTRKQNHPALHNCYSFKNMLKLLAFKWLKWVIAWNRTIRGHVNLVICIN